MVVFKKDKKTASKNISALPLFYFCYKDHSYNTLQYKRSSKVSQTSLILMILRDSQPKPPMVLALKTIKMSHLLIF